MYIIFRDTPEKFRISLKKAGYFEMALEQTGRAPLAKLLWTGAEFARRLTRA